MTAFQASLLDDASDVAVEPLAAGLTRHPLTDGAWVDVRPRWVRGADTLFATLRDTVDWRAERRPMYERVVDVPRLLHFVDEDQPLPDPVLHEARDLLDRHYAGELGERFVTAGLCLYRDGRDSVAWHGDRIGRGNTNDTMVAIIVLGEPRALMLRPRPASGRRCRSGKQPALRARPRRPRRHGRQLPAHLGALRAQDRRAASGRASASSSARAECADSATPGADGSSSQAFDGGV